MPCGTSRVGEIPCRASGSTARPRQLGEPPSARDRIRATLAKAGLAGAEQWALADDFEQNIRFAIDRDWMGELPRTQLIGRDGSVTTLSGAMDFSKLTAWLDEAKTP